MPSPPDREGRPGAEVDAAAVEAVVPTLRALTDDDRTLVQPPAEIWDRIRGELDADDTTPLRPGRTEPSVRDGRRGRGLAPLAALLAAAAVLVVVLAAAVIAVVTRSDDEVVARTNLETIDSGQVVGTAELVNRDGSQRLWVDVPDADAAESGFLELWLISDDVERLVSLGPVAPGRTRVALPAGVDVGEFPIVDVSVEPVDGNPSHSGDSIARGRLES